MSRIIQKVAARLGLYKYCVKIINSYKEKKEAKAVKEHGVEVLHLYGVHVQLVQARVQAEQAEQFHMYVRHLAFSIP